MDNIHRQAFQMLTYAGKLELLNPLTIAQVYEDQKLRIVGIVDQPSRTIEALYITLHLIPSPRLEAQLPSMNVPFQLPVTQFASGREHDSGTLVYYRLDRHPVYFRPGKWVAYLEQQYTNAQEQIRINMALNNQPVDDTALFPD